MPETASRPALVLGASGFLGGHVVRALAADSRRVRALVRPTSDRRGLAGVDCETVVGDLGDKASLEAAMDGCGTVFHCAVDARSWLTDPAPLYRANVAGLENAVEAALATGIARYVFTSSICTIGRAGDRPATEDDAFAWPGRVPEYVRTRVAAEEALLRACRERGLSGVALCVANTYGPMDLLPTPHGGLLWLAARGKMPFVLRAGVPCVDVRDAARALVLAETRGRTGERYIVSARDVPQPELFAMGAARLGRPGPRALPVAAVMAMARVNQAVQRLLRRTDFPFSPDSMTLASALGPYDNAKARKDLGWEPRPLEETIADAVAWFAARPRP